MPIVPSQGRGGRPGKMHEGITLQEDWPHVLVSLAWMWEGRGMVREPDFSTSPSYLTSAHLVAATGDFDVRPYTPTSDAAKEE